jgi:hypothetical protein
MAGFGGTDWKVRNEERECVLDVRVSSGRRYSIGMDAAPLSDIAWVAAEDFRRGRESVISQALARELAAAIELALLTAVRSERRACAAECTRRGELWQRTADQPDTSEQMRLEADHRANESLYLGDLIATRGG